jgi:hypothetical protein
VSVARHVESFSQVGDFSVPIEMKRAYQNMLPIVRQGGPLKKSSMLPFLAKMKADLQRKKERLFILGMLQLVHTWFEVRLTTDWQSSAFFDFLGLSASEESARRLSAAATSKNHCIGGAPDSIRLDRQLGRFAGWCLEDFELVHVLGRLLFKIDACVNTSIPRKGLYGKSISGSRTGYCAHLCDESNSQANNCLPARNRAFTL